MRSFHCNLTYLVGIAIEFDLLCLLETFVSSRLIYPSPIVDENILDLLLAKLVDVQQTDSKDS